MARNRTLKTSVFADDKLYDAEVETGLPLRIALLGLWTAADRAGRFRWSARALKHSCLPFDDVDFGEVLSALVAAGYLLHYRADGQAYGCVTGWDQPIHHREQASSIPGPFEAEAETSSQPIPRAEPAGEPPTPPPPKPPVTAAPAPKPRPPAPPDNGAAPMPTPAAVTADALDDLIQIAFMTAGLGAPPDMDRASAWIDAGYPAQVCLTIVKQAIAKGQDIPKLAVLDVPIRAAIVALKGQAHG